MAKGQFVLEMTVTDKTYFDLLVLGGGSAGITAVLEALQCGVQSVALVERRAELGGECALNACVPTKTLLTAAHYLDDIRHKAPLYGIDAGSVRLDYARLQQKKDAIIHEGDYDFMTDPRVTRLTGEAVFIGPRSIQVAGHTASAEHVVIATGATPRRPDIEGLSDCRIIRHDQAVHLLTLPQSQLILGGGAVGVEFAQMFQYLDCPVTLVQNAPRLLTKEEPDISEAVFHQLCADGVQVLLNATALSVTDVSGEIHLKVQTPEGEQVLQATDLLLATGVVPRLAALNLDAAGVAFDASQGIQVDDCLRTSNPAVFAVGDVVGPYRFTHTADVQAEIAVRNALLGQHQTMDYTAVPWAVYIRPAVGHVGLTEAQARAQYAMVHTVKATVAEVSRYRITSQGHGFIKLVIEGESHRLLGAHLFADGAEDLVQLLALAIQHQMSVRDLLQMIWVYPAKAQLVQKALERYDVDVLRPRAGAPVFS